MHDLHVRAGIDNLGQYRSKGKSEKLSRALHALSRAVEVPAYDYPLYSMVTHGLGYRLNANEENRSVTSDQWVEKALATYGCSIHGTRDEFAADGKRKGCSCNPKSRSSEVLKRQERNEESQHGVVERQGSTVPSASSIDWGSNISSHPSDVRSGRDRGCTPEEAHRLAIRSVYDSASPVGGRRRPIPLDEVVAKHIHHQSYAGLPLLDFNRNVLDAGARLASKLADGTRGFDPYLFGRRVQPGKSGPKTRLVWMASLPTTIVGTSFSKPVQDGLARNRPYIWGLRHHEEGSILAELAGRYRFVYCIDWSQFDARVGADLIDDMFRVVRSCLDLTEYEEKLFWRYVNDFIHTRLVVPSGYIYQVHKGVPSGSAFTSLIDSMANVYMCNYIWARLTGHVIPHAQLLVMGDDAVIGTDHRLQLEQMAVVAEERGFKLNSDKSVIVSTTEEGSGVHFIGHVWRHGRQHRLYRELIVRMALPERHQKTDLARSLMRLGGYALSSVEGLSILLDIYDTGDIVSAICQYLWELRTSEGIGSLSAHDLPGDLRRRVLVEGQQMPDLMRGTGPYMLLFGSVS